MCTRQETCLDNLGLKASLSHSQQPATGTSPGPCLISTMLPYPASLNPIVIPPSHLCLHAASVLFPSCFQNRFLYMFLIYHVQYTHCSSPHLDLSSQYFMKSTHYEAHYAISYSPDTSLFFSNLISKIFSSPLSHTP